MSRLNRIRAEIAHLKSSLHDLTDDSTYHPWMKSDRAAQTDALMIRLRKLRQQEFMLTHHSEPVPTDLMSLREHYSPDEKDIDFVVALLVGVAFIGVVVAFLLQAAGVLL